MSSKNIKLAIDFLSNLERDFKYINAIIFLLYKPVGRAKKNEILQDSLYIEKFFQCVESSKVKIGFDSCSVPAIVNHLKYNSASIESCEAGRFSAFVSEDLLFYPCSFMESAFDGVDLRKFPIREAWQKNELFNFMRTKKRISECKKCDLYKDCKGGCKIFPEINLCKKQSFPVSQFV